jgi:hypothetical protein
VSQADPDPWQATRARVAELLARREATFDDTAAAWTRFARDAGWRRADLEALWEGLTEDLVRRYARNGEAGRDTVRADVLAAMAALRERVLRELSA